MKNFKIGYYVADMVNGVHFCESKPDIKEMTVGSFYDSLPDVTDPVSCFFAGDEEDEEILHSIDKEYGIDR